MNICSLILALVLSDGERGASNEAVDTQRNRIIATDALKRAEPLADQGIPVCVLPEYLAWMILFKSGSPSFVTWPYVRVWLGGGAC